jgi:hypothetical protein
MERIGFGRQPYLVYRHFDADHPHIHIVTNTIRADSANGWMSYSEKVKEWGGVEGKPFGTWNVKPRFLTKARLIFGNLFKLSLLESQ